MNWECACGISNSSDKKICQGCGWTREHSETYQKDISPTMTKPPSPKIYFRQAMSSVWRDIRAAKKPVIIAITINTILLLILSIGFTLKNILLILFSFLPMFYLYYGLLRTSIFINRSEKTSINTLFVSISHLIKLIAASFILFASILIPILAVIMLGNISRYFYFAMLAVVFINIFIFTAFSLSIPLILDNKSGLFESFKISYKLTYGYKAQIFSVLFLIAFIFLPIDIINKLNFNSDSGLIYIVGFLYFLFKTIEFILMAFFTGYIYNFFIINSKNSTDSIKINDTKVFNLNNALDI